MRFEIHYRTAYRYAGTVTDNINTVRAEPVGTPMQQCEMFTITVTPASRVTRKVDYFGTAVHEFEVVTPHDALTIEVATRVTTLPPPDPPDPGWDVSKDDAYREAGAEFLTPHPGARPHPTLQRLEAEASGDTPLQSVLRLSEVIPRTFAYRKGVTYVGSTVADLLEANAGVCQDFVHLALAVVRGMDVAARYCSGYLFVGNGEGSRSVEVETHAWLEVMLPGDGGFTWVGVDPTNGGLVDERYVKIGHGRWYSDVPPVRGIFRGPAGGELTADVVMTLLDLADDA